MKNHGVLSKWLRHDDQKDLFEVLVASAMNVVFLALSLLLLWPLGRPLLAFRLAKGYGVLWGLTCVAALLGNRVQEFFRVNIYDRSNAYVISNLAVSCFLQVGWSAFAALSVNHFVSGAPVWMTVTLYLVGVLSCLVAFFAVSSFYQGHIYKLVSLPLALLSFIVFGVWPAGGRLMYGWFFELF
ncbi:MAG TPA: hypothetical protein VF240_00685 [Pyrinomonadaceae bacterium]